MNSDTYSLSSTSVVGMMR